MLRRADHLLSRPGLLLFIGVVLGLAAARLGLGWLSGFSLQLVGLVSLHRFFPSKGLRVVGIVLCVAGLALLEGRIFRATNDSQKVPAKISDAREQVAQVVGTLLRITPRKGSGPRVEIAASRVDNRFVSVGLVVILKRWPRRGMLPGDEISGRFALRPLRPRSLPGTWNRKRYYEERGITLEGRSLGGIRTRRAAAWRRWLPELSAELVRNLRKTQPPDWAMRDKWRLQHGAFLAAILLGDRQGLSADLTESFRRSGLYHLLAVSGLHLGLLSAAVFLFARLLLSYRGAAALTSLSVLFYLGLTSYRPSVARAGVMVLVYLLGIVLKRRPDPLNSVGIAAAGLLVWNPRLLGDIGFQMTVLATFSVLLYGKSMASQIRLPSALATSLGYSLAAQAGTFPVLLANFQRLSLFGALAYLAAAPLFVLSLALSLASASFSILLPSALAGVSHPLAKLACVAAAGLFEVSDFFAWLPGASIYLPHFSSVLVQLCLVLWLTFALPPTFLRATGQAILVCASGIVAITGLLAPASPATEIYFPDLGASTCALVRLPEGNDLLVYAPMGSPSEKGHAAEGLQAFLRDLGVDGLETVYLLRGGAEAALDLLSTLRPISVSMVKVARPVKVPLPSHLQEISLQGARLEWIQRLSDTRFGKRATDQPPLLGLRLGAFSVLLAGAIDPVSLLDSAELYGETIGSKLLQRSLSRSCGRSPPEFLKAVSPWLIIVSGSVQTASSGPCLEELRRLEELVGEDRVLRLWTGTVRISAGEDGVRGSRFSGGDWKELWSAQAGGGLQSP